MRGRGSKSSCFRQSGRVSFLGLAGVLMLWPSVAAAVSIELKDVAPDRIERQRNYAKGGLPLPNTPEVGRTAARLAEKGVAAGDPVMIRVFKASSELELWVEKDGVYVHFATYPICHWSGTLGPKQAEGDKQTPEGFYTVTNRQLHRLGRWTRALNLGFPNTFDQGMARSGSYILIHGGCSSVGCFAMTNPVMAEIYQLASAALYKGQQHIPVHVFPFRMTDENLDKYRTSEWHQFWMNIKEGYDMFERTHRPPRVSVCEDRYIIEEAGPEEVAAPSPLGVCAATAAHIAELERSNGFAPAVSRSSRQQAGRTLRARGAQCSMARASCRKFVSLRNRVAHRSHRRGVRTAHRAR